MSKIMKKFTLSLGLFFILATSNFTQVYAADKPMGHSNFEIIKIKTKMGFESSSAYFDGKSDKVVIFVPGAIFNKESWFFLAERLQQLNVASLSLDGKRKEDVLSAIKILKEKGFAKIILVGASMGGGSVLHALEEKTDDSIDKVIVLAPYGGSAIKSKKINKLFVIAKADRLGIYPKVKKIYTNSADPKKMVEYEGAEHAQHLFKSSHRDELAELLIDFINENN